MYRFLVLIEKGSQNYGAYAPDLPGCVAIGDTREEVERNMRKAIKMHLQGMIEDHEPIPTSQTTAEQKNGSPQGVFCASRRCFLSMPGRAGASAPQ